MKTMKFFSALSIAFLLLATTSVFAKVPVSNNTPGTTYGSFITYVVKFVQPSIPLRLKGTYYIEVTDDFGQPVAPPQIFKSGLWTYTFMEAGSVSKGIRTARMISDPQSVNPSALKVAPSTLNAPFYGGNTYTFVMSFH